MMPRGSSRTLLLILVFGVSLTAPASAAFRFAWPYLSFDVGTPRSGPGPHVIAPVSGVAADFNGDGHLDVATANLDDASVTVLFGLGNGRLTGKTDILVGKSPHWIRAGDLDMNGGIDLVVACVDDSVVTVLWGAGDGTFPGRTDLAVPGNPTSVAVADLQGSDPYWDIAVASKQGPIWVFRNNSGFFSAPSSILGGGAEASSIAAADMNLDGLNDLIVPSHTPSQVSVFLGTGNARYDPPASMFVSGGPNDVVVSDMDQNGSPDVVTVASGSLAVLKGNGDGTLMAPTTYSVSTPYGLATGDFNSDGLLDVATNPFSYPSTTLVLLGSGGGALGAQSSFPTGSGANDIVPGDFDEDGILDLVTVNGNDETVAVLHGNGDGTFGADRFVEMSSSSTAGTISDLDGDNWPDLVAVKNGSPGGVNLRLNPYGSFGPEVSYPSDYGVHVVAQMGDLNGDGLRDIVLGSSASAMTVLLGTGNGAFGAPTSYFTWPGPTEIDIGDLNGDGREDVLDAHSNLTSVWLSNSSGVLEWLYDAPVSHPIVLGDFNEDGKLDLVGGNYPQKIALGNGDGSFGTAVAISYFNPSDLQIADLNGDGHSDLVGNDALGIFTMLGDGGGNFTEAGDFSIKYISKLALGDFDRDGDTDLAVAEQLRGIIKLYRGNGDGTFDYEVDVGIAKSTSYLSVADFNRDGAPDLAAFLGPPAQNGFRILYDAAPAPVGLPPTEKNPLPFSLLANPARGRLGVQFELPEAGPVRVEILDLRGRRVATLADQAMPAGPHALTWKGDSNNGPAVASGLYVVRLEHSGKVEARKAIWLGK